MQASPTLVTSTTPSSTTTTQCDLHGQEIRTRLLRRLGIPEQEHYTLLDTSQRHDEPRPPPASFRVPLKYYKEQQDSKQQQQHDTNNDICPKQTKSVAFQEDVSVVPIPMRTEYSSRTSQRLWCKREELQQMAQRNLREFEFEGWNWRNVIEDGCMIVWGEELIHPAHARDLLQWDKQQQHEPAPLHRLADSTTHTQSSFGTFSS